MCRSIKRLRTIDGVAGDDEIRAAARQFVRKVSGVSDPTPKTSAAFQPGAHVPGPTEVKHFKGTPAQKGKGRIHEKPKAPEIAACRFWLATEIALLKPRIIVAPGATAAQALFGRQFKVTRQRGKPIATPLAAHGIATVHPSSILRAPDDATRRAEYQAFVRDLKIVARSIDEG